MSEYKCKNCGDVKGKPNMEMSFEQNDVIGSCNICGSECESLTIDASDISGYPLDVACSMLSDMYDS